jgi:hypothetical protein
MQTHYGICICEVRMCVCVCVCVWANGTVRPGNHKRSGRDTDFSKPYHPVFDRSASLRMVRQFWEVPKLPNDTIRIPDIIPLNI